MIRPAFALLAALVAVGTVRAEEDELPGPAIKWPDVKGMDRQKPNKFKDKALGYSVAYTSDVTVATVFVYNLDVDKIPTGPDSNVIKAEMYESLLALEANKKSGRYKNIVPIDEAVIPFGTNKDALKIRRKRYEIELPKEGTSVTELYVTGYKNYFIKIRATYPAESKAKGEKNMTDLLNALGKELK